jgi:hypothetical protein
VTLLLLLSAPFLVLAALALLGAYAVRTAKVDESFPQHGN